MSGNDNIKVIVKLRPLIKRENDAKLTKQWLVNGNTIECNNPLATNNRFLFDEICDENSSTKDLYDKVAKPIVQSALDGFNGTIFAYGQTSSGKTHTMLGTSNEPGVIPLAVRQIFSGVKLRLDSTFLLKVSYIEIYNEKIYDLLNERNEVKIKEIANGELHIERKEKIVVSEKDIMGFLAEGNNLRRVAETNMNVQSSRSHTIFSIMIESEVITEEDTESPTVVSLLNLVDLAGSERADATGATGNRLKEGSHINKSLLSLSMVIAKLSEGQDQHINYRDSKLTRLLQLSLGGNAMTAIICTVTPAVVDETNFTLLFAQRAKKVKNKPVVNHVMSEALSLKKMKKQIAELEEQLNNERKQHNEYIKKEKRLNILKNGIIQTNPNPNPKPTATNRRKTWSANLNLSKSIECKPENGNAFEMEPTNKTENFQFKFSEFGHQIEYSDEQFESMVDASFISTTRSEYVRLPKPSGKKSLLATPKSIRNIWSSGSRIDETAGLASPIGTDKDKLIKRLEDELEELAHFQQTEATMRSADIQTIDSLESQLKEKADESAKLNEKLEQQSEQIESLNEQLKTVNQQSVDQKKKMDLDVRQAIKSKCEAEQQLAGVELQYEQRISKLNQREKELVEQLETLRSADVVKELKEKLKLLTEKVTSVETELWQNENAHKAEIEKILSQKKESDEKCNKYVNEIDNFRKLQDEYDEVSGQLVDVVMENDELKKKLYDQIEKIENLEKAGQGLELQLKNNVAAAENSDNSASYAHSIRMFDTLSIVTSYYITRSEQYSIKLDEMSTKLRSESDLLALEIEKSKKLSADVEQMKMDLVGKDDDHEMIEKLSKELENQKEQHSRQMGEMSQDSKTKVDSLVIECEKSAKLSSEIEQLKLKLNEQNNVVEAVEVLSKQLETQKEQYLIQLDELNNNLKNKTDSLAIECEKSSKLATEIEDLKTKLAGDETAAHLIEDLSKQLESEQTQHMIAIAELHDDLKRKSENFTTDSMKLSEEIVDLKEKLADKEKIEQSYKESIEELKKEKEFKVQELSAANESLREKVDAFGRECDRSARLEADINELKMELSKAVATDGSIQELMNTLAEQRNQHESELKQLKAKYDQEMSESIQKLETNYKELENELENQKILNVTIASEREIMLKDCVDLEHENNMLSKACEQCNMMVQFMVKEMEVLRQSYTELRMSVAEQELGHLKLQRTFSESNNFSMLDITDLDGTLQPSRNSTLSRRATVHEVPQMIPIPSIAPEALVTENTEYEEKFNSIMERFATALSKDDATTLEDNYITILEKFLFVYREFEALMEFLKADKQHGNAKMIIELIELERTEKLNIANEKQMIHTEFKSLKDKHNQLKSHLDAFEKENANMSDTTIKQRKEIKRLQEMVAESGQVAEERAGLQQTLNSKNQFIQRLTAEIAALNKSVAELQESKRLAEMDNAKIEGLQQTVEEGHKKVQDAFAEIEMYKGKLAENAAKIVELRDELRESNENLSSRAEELTKLTDELQSLRRAHIELGETKVQLEKSLADKNAEIEQSSTEMKSLRKLFEEGVEMKQKLNATLVELNNKNEQLNEKQDQIAQLEHKLVHQTDENRNFQSKFDQLMAEKRDLTKTIDALKNQLKGQEKIATELAAMTQRMNEITKELTVAKSLNAQLKLERIELDEQIKCLQAKQNSKLLNTSIESDTKSARKSMSPMRGNRSNPDLDRLLHENNNLRSMQTKLEKENEELRRNTIQGRKIKRHSTHDDTRRISGFDACMLDIGTQTDASSELCRCSEYCATIKKLRKDIIIGEAKYSEFRRHTGVDQLKDENNRFKATISQLKTEISSLNGNLENLTDKYQTLKLRNDIAKKETAKVNAAIQTNIDVASNGGRGGGRTFCDEVDMQRAIERAEKYKKGYVSKEAECSAVKAEYDKLIAECKTKSEQILKLSAEIEQLQEKYSGTKRLCNHRADEIAKFKKELEMMKKKYDLAKNLLQKRAADDSRRNGDDTASTSNIENVPNNFER